MGSQILRQPGGLYAVFSSESDTIVAWDATEDEIVEYYVRIAAERARRDVQRTLGFVAAGEPRRAYFQFALSWDRALAEDQEHGGEAWQHFQETGESDPT